jgi:hypothetical protein
MTEYQNTEEQGGQQEQRSANQPKKNNSFLTSAAIIVAIILAFVLLRPASAPVEERENNVSDSAEQEIIQDKKEFEWTAPNAWEHLERATNAIQSLTPGQVIESGILQDPTNENVVYFAASAFDEEKLENLVSVYQYQTDDYNFERLFRTTYAEGGTSLLGDEAVPVFHVVGYDNNNLILLIQDYFDSPDPCGQPLLLGMQHGDSRNLVSMSINDPYSGVETYTPPQDVIKEFQQKELTCLEKLQ